MVSSISLISCSALCLVLIAVQLRRKTKWRMPPGPTPGLLGDNRWSVPFYQPWRRYTEWHKIFGELLSIGPGHIRAIMFNNDASCSQGTLSHSGWVTHLSSARTSVRGPRQASPYFFYPLGSAGKSQGGHRHTRETWQYIFKSTTKYHGVGTYDH
jgi:hypothetical protein